MMKNMPQSPVKGMICQVNAAASGRVPVCFLRMYCTSTFTWGCSFLVKYDRILPDLQETCGF